MKNLNLIERLWTDSHEKQTPQRFARYAAILIMLLTLGVGQMWGSRTYDGSEKLYIKNIKPSGWGSHWINATGQVLWVQFDGNSSTNTAATFISGSGKDAYNDSYYELTVPSGTYSNIVIHRGASLGATWNKTNSISLNSTANVIDGGYSADGSGATWNTFLDVTTSTVLYFKIGSWWYNSGCNHYIEFYTIDGSTQTLPAYDLASYLSNNATTSTTSSTSNDKIFVTLPTGVYKSYKMDRKSSDSASGGNHNQSSECSFSSSTGKNQVGTMTNGGAISTWDTNKPSSAGSVTPSSSSVSLNTAVTMNPSLTSNTLLNNLKSTAYGVSPGTSGTDWTMVGNVFTPLKAGTYTITATITYNAKGFPDLTSTVAPTTTVTAYATITFNNHGADSGKEGTTSVNAVKGSNASAITPPQKTGYVFQGYYTGENGAGTQIIDNTGAWLANKSGYTDNSSPCKYNATTNSTLHAYWTGAATKYTITYGVGTGYSLLGTLSARNTTDSEDISSGDKVLAAKAITFTATPSQTYYEVEGFYSDAACTSSLQSGNSTTYTIASLGDDANVYVKFKPITYNITYNLNSGTNNPGNPATYTYESSAITLQDPTRDGYTFGGWYTEVGLTNRVYTIAAGSTGNKEYWAKWTPKNYSITYDPVSAPEGVTYTTTPSNANCDATVDMVFTPTGDNTVIVSVVDGSSNPVAVTNPSANTYRFTMPASNVTVSVSVQSLPMVYVLKTKSGSAYFPDGFTSGGSNTQVKIWAWKASDDTNFYSGDYPGQNASSKASEYTDAHGNVWWRFIPENDGFTRSTPFKLILVYHNGGTQYKIYESNGTHYISDGTKRTSYNGSANDTFTGTVWVVPGGTSANTATLYYENPSSSKKFCFVEGRFKAYTDKSRQTVLYTDPNDGTKWGTNSTNIRMFYDETNSRYYLHTYCTPNELRSISSNNGYIHLTTSTVTSSLTGGSAFYANSSENLTAADTKINFSATSGSRRPYITSTATNKYVVLYWDGTKMWYEEESIMAAIDEVNLSVTRVPPTAPITATPTMYDIAGVGTKAYCWGVYTDEECTSKVNSVSFTSLGDGKVQFMAPQEQGTYYLKLTVHSSDDCNATIDDEEVVSFTVTTDDMVFFKNVPGWGNVHVYFLGTSDYWDTNLGSGCAGRDYGIAHGMTRIGNSDVYYYDYYGNSNVVFDGDGKAYIAFTDNYKPNSDNFSECQAVYRGDFSKCAAMFVPENWITHYLNNAAYYNRGYWTNYMSASSGFKLYIWDKTANNADGEHQILATDVLTSSVVGGNTYTYEYDFGDDPYNSETRPYTYGFKFEGCGGSWYGAEDDMNITKCTDWNLGTDTRKCGISVTVNQKHKFILTLAGDGHVQVSVEYPVSIGDYRLLYDDNTQTPHPSQFIRKRANGKDTVAMYVRPSETENLKVQYCTGIDGETITWANYNWTGSDATGAIDVSSLEDGVYVFYLVQDASGNLTVNTSETKPYLGKYYIRTSCVDGGWNSYKSTSDNLMTYAQYPEEKGYGFNYYKAKWVGTTGTDVTYTIACDFSPALCDTLVADEGNNPLSDPEARSLPHAANIRFGWHSKTNKLKRAYINGSTNVADRFLVMIGDEKLKDKDGNALSISGLNANEISFSDLNNWIYRCDITAVEGAAVKLTANYDSHVQYFIGTSEKPEEILGGTGSKEYLMRVTYDFKTNRLMTAWLPNGNQITGDVELKADMMLIREGQNAATQVYFNGNNHKITEVKTIFGVMEFQYDHIAGQFPSWSAPNAYKYLMYYISFPFDVKVSEIFGAGVRGENWIIQKYNGARRAQIGWFAETPTFWETLPGDSTLHANEGYLLLLDRISFNDPSSSIWYKQGSGNSVYLYFPSVSNSIGTIKDANEEVTIKIPSHTCTIERPFTPDIDGWSGGKLVHSNTDSHWNVFGIPLFQSKAATTVGDSELKYFYSWNYTDNTLRPQVTLAGDTVFKSMHGYMVQFAGDVTFTGAHISASVAARRMPSNKHYLAELQLVNENGDENATYVELRENANTDFQLNEDMYMMRSSNTVDLYSFAGAYDVAANVLPIDDQLVRVGVDVKRAGTYRFTMPSEFSGTVTLIDNLMGTRTNMALGDHEVYLERGVDNNRFQLEINIQSSTTSLEGNDVKDGGAHKFIENGQMYILQNGVIYDARGNRVQ